MQHWYFSVPASSNSSLVAWPLRTVELSKTAALAHSGATVLRPAAAFSVGTTPPPKSSTSVKDASRRRC